MKKLKKFLALLFLGIFVLEFSFFSVTQAKVLCGTVTGYALFKCRVDDICKKYYDGPKKSPDFDELLEKKDTIYDDTTLKRVDAMGRQVYRSLPYLKAEEYYKEEKLLKKFSGYNSYPEIPFYVATQTYKNNMNGIYNCAIIYSRLKVLKEIERLLAEDNTGEIRKKINNKLKEKIKKIEDQIGKIDENSKNDETGLLGTCRKLNSQKLFKRDVLREVTYETCKYRVYMEYLKEYYSENIRNLVRQKPDEDGKEADIRPMDPKDFAYLEDEILAKIDTQLNHSYLVFDKAFREYVAFEGNYYIHEMLELLKVNFIVLRIKLHNVLTPMNQVVYKISNVMKLQ